ncbi:MAG: LysE family translocator [Pseudomonadota bacterium]
MTVETASLAAPAAAFLIAAGSPGPATLAVAATSMSRGRSAGLACAVGLWVALSLWGLVAAAGIGALMATWAPAMIALRLIGGAYLLYLAWQSMRSALADHPVEQDAADCPNAALMFWRGMLLNAMNPKALLAWMAVIVIGLPPGAGTGDVAIIFALCSAIGLGLYVLYAMLFSTGRAMRFYLRLRRWIEGGCALLFGAAGLGLLFRRVDTP